MGSIFKFLQSLTRLASKGDIKIDDAYKFAKQEFGEVSDLLKLQINKIFKQSKAPSIKKPEKKSSEVVPIKKDQASGSIMDQVDESMGKIEDASSRISQIQKEIDAMYKPKPETSPLMSRLDEGIQTLKKMKRPGMDLATGLTRTSVRKILEKNGIQVPDKADPIEVFATNFGADALMDVKNVAEEMLELEQMGKVTKSIDEVLEQEGMFDIKINKDAPQGMSQDELRQIKKEVDQEKMFKDFDPTDREPNAMGGRIGFAVGSLPKGIQSLVKTINKKFGKAAMKTADEIDRPKNVQAFDDFETRNPDPKRQLTDDEIRDYEAELGDSETWMMDGTVGEAETALKNQKAYMADMELEYKKGNLDPVAGDKSPARKRFLEQKLEEMEASGDKRLMTIDEIEELSSFDLGSEMDVVKSLAPKMVERMQLKQKYPGITDDLLDKILIDDNMQRKAEVLATIDEAFIMLEKGKGTDEILDTMKNVTRKDNNQGGLNYLMGL